MSMAISKEEKSVAKSLIPRIRALFSFREAGILLVLLVLCAILSLIAPRFLTVKNLQNVARQFSVIAIMSVGMTYVIITAGIDLSVGSVIALSGCMTAWYLVDGYPIWFSVLIGLGLGALTGLVNGLLIVKINLAPFIATLGTMGIARGVVLALTMGYPIQPFPEEFQFLGRGSLGPIPIPVVIMTIIIILGHIFLTRTTTGRYIYYVGSNPTAARLSGLKVGRILILVYTLAGLLAGVSAVVLISRLTSAQSNMGMGWELDAIAAVVIGGTSLAGGEGSVLGSLIGAALMGVIKNALILLGVNVYWQSVVIGIVIVLAVGLDAWRQSRRRI
jgi:ribose transport system permease protein